MKSLVMGKHTLQSIRLLKFRLGVKRMENSDDNLKPRTNDTQILHNLNDNMPLVWIVIVAAVPFIFLYFSMA